jgi:hypothetical protein
MKNILFNSLVLFALCLVTQTASAQQVAELDANKETVLETAKDKLLTKYSWLSNHLKDEKNISSIKEMQYGGITDFVMIKTNTSQVLYDADGQRYCTNSPELNCKEHYNLSAGALEWNRI